MRWAAASVVAAYALTEAALACSPAPLPTPKYLTEFIAEADVVVSATVTSQPMRPHSNGLKGDLAGWNMLRVDQVVKGSAKAGSTMRFEAFYLAHPSHGGDTCGPAKQMLKVGKAYRIFFRRDPKTGDLRPIRWFPEDELREVEAYMRRGKK